MHGEQLHFPTLHSAELPRTNGEFDRDNEPIECAHCGCEVHRDEAIDFEGKPHCDECVHICENCGYCTVDSDELHEAYTSGYYRRNTSTEHLCNDCAWKCADCGEWFKDGVDSGTNTSDEQICMNCAESYTSCEACECVIHQDDSYFDDHAEQTLCRYCYDNREEQNEDDEDDEEERPTRNSRGQTVIYGHWHKPAPVFHALNGTSRYSAVGIPYFGVEIEVDRQARTNRVDDIMYAGLFPSTFYHCENDGSLDMGGTDSGFEIVSNPATWPYWQACKLEWMDKLRERGWRSYDTTTCGMHVHVSRSFLTKLDQFKLLAFFRNNVALMRRLSRRKGGESSYAKFDTSNTAALCYKVKSGPAHRYEAINFENPKTIEFRLFRGTLNQTAFRRNLALVVAITHFVKWAGFRQLTPEHFRVWVKVEGRKILGKPDALSLVTWLNECISGEPSADVAA